MPCALLVVGSCTTKNVPSNWKLIETKGMSYRVVNHDIVERILVFVISDNEIGTVRFACGECCQIMVFDHENVTKMKEAQFVVQWIRIGVHSSVSDRAFSIRAMTVLALIGVFCIFVQVEVVIEKITVHQNGSDHRGTVVAQQGKKIKAGNFHGISSDLDKCLTAWKTAIVIHRQAPWVSSIGPLNELFYLEPQN